MPCPAVPVPRRAVKANLPMQFKTTVAASIAATLSSSALAGVIYATDFSEFALGDINGQNGWATYDPTFTSGGGNFANVVADGASGKGVQFLSGTGGTSSPRYAWAPGYGSQWQAEALAGNRTLSVSVDMKLSSGAASTARIGVITFDDSGAKILGGFYVEQSTRRVYMLGYYNNAGTLGNFAFNTGVTLALDTWTNFVTEWDSVTGRFTVAWGANAFYVDGAGAGSNADETDLYATRNGSTVSASAYFDNLSVSAVPAPGALALLGAAGLAGARRRRA